MTAVVKGSEVSASVKVSVDPSIQTLKAYIGNEKLLETQEDYDELLEAEPETGVCKTAWKGDVLNSKIVVLSRNRDVHQAEITVTDFTDEKGNVISSENVGIKWLKEIKANDGRNQAGVVKSYPDIIHKGGAADIDAESVKFAWVNIDIPKDAIPGVYTGGFTVNAEGLETPIDLVYTIEVLNLLQPAPEATQIQVWQHPFSVANYYLGLGENVSVGGISNELRSDFYFTEEHFNLMRSSMEEYVAIGGHDVVANIVEEAWNHQSFYNDPSMVKWTKKADGTWEFDYTWYDAWIEFMIDCGVINPQEGIGQIKCYSIVPWNNQIAYYDETLAQTVRKSLAPGSEEWNTVWETFLGDFMEHSKENGWFEVTYISMDERGLDQLEPAVDIIESVQDESGKSFKISSALNYAAPEYYDFTDHIDDISVNLRNISDKAQMNELSLHRRELGLTTTYYSCTEDYPTNYTISDPGDNYWTILYSMTLGTDGFMRWAGDNYVYNMHEDVTYRYWEPGDGWFIYPAERDILDMSKDVPFYSTPRYELFKQGIRDVAKAKYLMAQDDQLSETISVLMADMKRPARGTYHGSAVAATQEDRMLVHSETEHVYTKLAELARDYLDEKTTDFEETNKMMRT